MASPVNEQQQQQQQKQNTTSAEERKPSVTAAKEIQGSPKRKSSEAATEDAECKKKRRKVNHACVYCRRSHMTCDLERPCARCKKRDIGHLCHDEPREPPKRTKSDLSTADIAPAPTEALDAQQSVSTTSNGAAHFGQNNGDMNIGLVNGSENPHLAQPKPLSPVQLQRPTTQSAGSHDTNNFLQNFDWNSNALGNQFQDMHHLHPNYMFNTSEVTNEYNLLNDFLSSSLLDDSTGLYSHDDAQVLFNDPLLSASAVNAIAPNHLQPPSSSSSNQPNPPQQLQAQPAAGNEISRPSSAFPSGIIDSKARDKFYMTAADPAGLESASNRLHKLLKAKWDAGMLKPFNYVKGYSRLSQYISKHLTRESQLRILKQLDRFRPKFREAMQNLNDMQLVLVEMWFERSLMEYDRVFASMAIPACCWRRTGEIFRGNTEMADLIRVPLEKLRDGKLAIHEIVAEDSLVSYWEKFGAIAFDQSQKAILTSCALKRPVERPKSPVKGGSGKEREGEGKAVSPPMETVRCCFSFTIRRDGHNIPSLIVGNFLPIAPRRQSS